jgi:hypothetical protein
VNAMVYGDGLWSAPPFGLFERWESAFANLNPTVIPSEVEGPCVFRRVPHSKPALSLSKGPMLA